MLCNFERVHYRLVQCTIAITVTVAVVVTYFNVAFARGKLLVGEPLIVDWQFLFFFRMPMGVFDFFTDGSIKAFKVVNSAICLLFTADLKV